jgi:RNA polymerase sigma-70 factor (ECF subfamily)
MAPADEPEQAAPADRHLAAESDGELLCRIAEQDLEAFEALYRRYIHSVYGLALDRLGDRPQAEDATGRAFAAIWRSAPTYVPEPGGGARWLFDVAWNAIVEERPEPPAEDGWPAFRVQAAVAELPEREREALELAYWEGRSRSEIAELLGLSPGAVETRTRSALARLAVRLEGLIRPGARSRE